MEGKGLLKFGLVLLVAGSISVSGGSAAQLLGQSDLTATLYDTIGGTCFLLGFGAELLAMLIARAP